VYFRQVPMTDSSGGNIAVAAFDCPTRPRGDNFDPSSMWLEKISHLIGSCLVMPRVSVVFVPLGEELHATTT
jgi:hypothetical protein